MADQIALIGLSDAPTLPTGFGRVFRELWQRLPKDRFRLAALAEGWVGTVRLPGVACYVAHSVGGRDKFCRDSFPVAVDDFAPEGPVLVWTLMDPWQTAWLAFWGSLRHTTPANKQWFARHRSRLRWIGHFPIDGEGPRAGEPPLWTKDWIMPMNRAVVMSEFGRRLISFRSVDYISHAVDTDVYVPGDRDAARETVNLAYAQTLREVTANLPEEQAHALWRRRFILEPSDFVVISVMANRSRKNWPQLLEAIAALSERVTQPVKLIAVCGDREGRADDAWPLVDYAAQIGLRPDQVADNPTVWLLESVGRDVFEADAAMAQLYRAADVAVLWSYGEGFGLPQLEAHACGLPCIVGRYSASAELVVDDREAVEPRGYHYVGINLVRRPQYRRRDLVERLVYAARNPGWRQEVGAKGRAQAILRSWDRILPQWTALFEEEWQRAGGDA